MKNNDQNPQEMKAKSLLTMVEELRESAKELANLTGEEKNRALEAVIESLEQEEKAILQANEKDLKKAREAGVRESLLDRLALDSKRMQGMKAAIREVIALKDPVWSSSKTWTLENGLTLSQMTVPLGVIGIIYESRPNVTVDAFSLAFKSGNGVVLRGSSSALNSNRALVKAIHHGLEKAKISSKVLGFIDDEDRGLVLEMLHMKGKIDLIIPRGGKGLIDFVVENAKVPTVETGVGNCHLFVDDSAEFPMALEILKNGKVQRPGVCNALETLLIHEDVAEEFLQKVPEYLKGVTLRGCEITEKYITVEKATEEDWKEEYLDLILAIRVVKDLDQAIEHIAKYGTGHSEAIVTKNYHHAQVFQRKVDAAAVYVNASTRFTDGGAFGFGGEMGISTQKVHARGPMGLWELVTTKYIAQGDGQIRG